MAQNIKALQDQITLNRPTVDKEAASFDVSSDIVHYMLYDVDTLIVVSFAQCRIAHGHDVSAHRRC